MKKKLWNLAKAVDFHEKVVIIKYNKQLVFQKNKKFEKLHRLLREKGGTLPIKLLIWQHILQMFIQKEGHYVKSSGRKAAFSKEKRWI